MFNFTAENLMKNAKLNIKLQFCQSKDFTKSYILFHKNSIFHKNSQSYYKLLIP